MAELAYPEDPFEVFDDPGEVEQAVPLGEVLARFEGRRQARRLGADLTRLITDDEEFTREVSVAWDQDMRQVPDSTMWGGA